MSWKNSNHNMLWCVYLCNLASWGWEWYEWVEL